MSTLEHGRSREVKALPEGLDAAIDLIAALALEADDINALLQDPAARPRISVEKREGLESRLRNIHEATSTGNQVLDLVFGHKFGAELHARRDEMAEDRLTYPNQHAIAVVPPEWFKWIPRSDY